MTTVESTGYFKKQFQTVDFYDQISKEREFFNKLKRRGMDPSLQIESSFEDFLPDKLAALFDEPILAEIIRSCLPNPDRLSLCLELMNKLDHIYKENTIQEKCDKILRRILGLLTDGVTIAPLDGLGSITVDPVDNFLRIEVSGPIRSAGGSICAQIFLMGEYLRLKYNLNKYNPTEEEIDRGIAESLAYIKKHPSQIRPAREELEFVLKNCPIMVDATESEKEQVPIHKYLPRIPKPRIRGGLALVIIEGFILKALKLVPIAKELKIDHQWITQLCKLGASYRKIGGSRGGDKDSRYSLTIGRPLISTSENPRGLSVRIGTSPTVALCGVNVTEELIDLLKFINIGSQLVVSAPGKAMCISGTCSDLRKPLVKYIDGVRPYSIGTSDQVLEILDVGEVLVSVGDYIESNKQIPPRDYCKGMFRYHTNNEIDIDSLSTQSLLNLYKKYPNVKIPSPISLPLNNISYNQFLKIRAFDLDSLQSKDEEILKLLESINVEYFMDSQGKITITNRLILEHYLARDLNISFVGYSDSLLQKPVAGSGLIEYINSLSQDRIMLGERGTYTITARVGRAESVNLTKLKPKNCHSLCEYKSGSSTELFWNSLKRNPYGYGKYKMRSCSNCGITPFSRCFSCDTPTSLVGKCMDCGVIFPWSNRLQHAEHKCQFTIPLTIDYLKELDLCKLELGEDESIIDYTKQVKLKESSHKVAYPQPFIKGLLRANLGLPVTKDGTFRICSPNLPTTHFTPRECHTSIKNLIRLGYTEDIHGNQLTQQDQILALKIHDVIIAQESVPIFINACKYLDILIHRHYKGPVDYFNVLSADDLIGVSVYSISPHTSNAPLGRIIGYTINRGFYSHPLAITNRRRDCDGDIDGWGLLADSLLNSGKLYCEGKMGALMSVPLNFSQKLYIDEVGKEILAREIVSDYYFSYGLDNTKSHLVKELKKIMRVEHNLDRKIIPPEEYHFNTPGFKLNSRNNINYYLDCESNEEKIDLVLKLSNVLVGVNQTESIIGLIEGHLIPDYIGNLNAYFKQKLKCSVCKMDYEVEPLDMYCLKCKKGIIKQTVYKGMVLKYIKLIKKLKKLVVLPSALEERLEMIFENIRTTFENDKSNLRDLLDE